jgi:hypothetical protein
MNNRNTNPPARGTRPLAQAGDDSHLAAARPTRTDCPQRRQSFVVKLKPFGRGQIEIAAIRAGARNVAIDAERF